MLGGRRNDKVELECPECKTRFEVSEKDAAKGKVRCPRGHEVGVMGILGGPQ